MSHDVLFVNHLVLGSASSYRQCGLAKYLARQGYRCELLAPGPKGGVKLEPGARGGVLEGFHRVSTLKSPLVGGFASNLRLLREAARRNGVVHINRANPYTASLALLDRRAVRRLVVDMEDWDGLGGYTTFARRYGPSGFMLTLFEDTFPRSADEVLVVSRLLCSRMMGVGVPRDRISIVPNGFDPELFHEGMPDAGLKERYGLDGYPILIYASTFWPFEMAVHRLVLEAFRLVLKSLPEARLLVVGKGYLPVKEMAVELGVGERVTFTGFLPREDLPRAMAAADVAIHMISDHPFHQASSPMIVPEYMAMGKALVAPRVGELNVMLGGGAGLLIDRPDPEMMASAVSRVSTDEGLRESLGREAASRAARLYSYDALARRVAAVYSRQ